VIATIMRAIGTAVLGPGRQCWRCGVLVLMVGCLLAGLAAPALGRVEISRKRVLVQTRTAGALITRSPFRITFRSSDGRAVVSEVRNSRPRPKRMAPTPDPIAPGFDSARQPPLYSPLTFTVGKQTLAQYQGGLFGGNLMSGTRSGVRYAARKVLRASRAGNGVRLVLATNDPSGRADGA
jgi:hypothetical protein